MEDLSLKPFQFQQRVADCKTLFVAHHGRHHEEIERQMRGLGHATFNRRVLYARNERGRSSAGWPERFGWAARRKKAKRRKYSARHRRQARRRLTVRAFSNWLKKVSPHLTWTWKYQQHVYRQLERVANGECKRLMIFMPPRHGKSELVTVRYAAWMLKNHPKMNIIIGSYAQKLANRFSRKMRNVLADDGSLASALSDGKIQHDAANCDFCKNNPPKCPAATAAATAPAATTATAAAPTAFRVRRINTEAEWETPQGGGVRAVGVGAGITGFGADLIIVDDPVKSRAEAESATYRDNLWDWFNDDLYTRLEPNGAIILIQTRWHEDDLAGRLLRESAEEGGEQWEVVNLPALAEGMSPQGTRKLAQGKAEGRHPGLEPQHRSDPAGVVQTSHEAAPLQGAEVMEPVPEVTLPSSAHPRLISVSPSATGDPLGRAPGEALCPARYNEESLERVRKKLGSYSFAALYQQRPIPAEGGLFKRSWFKNIITHAPEGLRWTRGYDLAMTDTSNADYTASYRTAYDREGNLYIDGGYRARIEYPEQRKYILGRIREEADTHQHCVELSANGNAVIQDLHRDSRALGRALRGLRAEGSKISRALPWIALAEAGKVFLVRGGWNTQFIEEACSFPAGTHDDQIDAVSIAVKMSRPRVGGRAWSI